MKVAGVCRRRSDYQPDWRLLKNMVVAQHLRSRAISSRLPRLAYTGRNRSGAGALQIMGLPTQVVGNRHFRQVAVGFAAAWMIDSQ